MPLTLQENQLILPLSGRIAIASQQPLYALIDAGLRQGYTNFILDLYAVNAIDSAGLRVLLGCTNRAQQHGAHMALARVPVHISALMELTRVRRFFAMCEQADR